jgi:hypothetical protein
VLPHSQQLQPQQVERTAGQTLLLLAQVSLVFFLNDNVKMLKQPTNHFQGDF